MHEVETLMYAGKTPWHGIGKYVGETRVTSAQAIQAAGLDWRVVKAKLSATMPRAAAPAPDPCGGQVIQLRPAAPAIVQPTLEEIVSINDHVALVRDTDHAVLGIAGDGYQPVQNVEAFTFMDGLVDEGLMTYEVAGSLKGGRRVFLLGKVGSVEVVPKDRVDQFIFFWNSHDGWSALRCFWTAVRVVCMNTARAALRQGVGEGITLRHTAGITGRLEDAKKVLGLAKTSFDETTELYRRLTGLTLTAAQWQDLAHVAIPDPEDEKVKTDRREEQRQVLAKLYVAGRGSAQFPQTQGTGWAAYNAVTEYVTWEAPKRGENGAAQERRFEDALVGPGAEMVQRATEWLQDQLPLVA